MGVWSTVKEALGMGTCSAGAASAPSAVPRSSLPAGGRAADAPTQPADIVSDAGPAVQAPVIASEPTFGLLNADRFSFGPRVATRPVPPTCDGILNECLYEWWTFKSRLVNADRYEWRLPNVVNAARFGWRERLMN